MSIFTVAFEGNIRGIKTSPFNIVSEFGTPVTIGVGNSFEEADGFREALEQIAEGSGKAADIASAALDAADRRLVEASK